MVKFKKKEPAEPKSQKSTGRPKAGKLKMTFQESKKQLP
jgi:hypothetical protein